MSAAAEALQAAIRHEAGRDEIERLTTNLVDALTPLIDGIRVLPVEQHTVPANLDPAHVAAVLSRLEVMLQQRDPSASALAQREAAVLHVALGAARDDILHSISVFDYEGARCPARSRKGPVNLQVSATCRVHPTNTGQTGRYYRWGNTIQADIAGAAQALAF